MGAGLFALDYRRIWRPVKAKAESVKSGGYTVTRRAYLSLARQLGSIRGAVKLAVRKKQASERFDWEDSRGIPRLSQEGYPLLQDSA
jgi:hypothetical protein